MSCRRKICSKGSNYHLGWKFFNCFEKNVFLSVFFIVATLRIFYFISMWFLICHFQVTLIQKVTISCLEILVDTQKIMSELRMTWERFPRGIILSHSSKIRKFSHVCSFLGNFYIQLSKKLSHILKLYNKTANPIKVIHRKTSFALNFKCTLPYMSYK